MENMHEETVKPGNNPLLITFIVLMVIGVGGYYWFTSQQNNAGPKIVVTPTASLSPTVTPTVSKVVYEYPNIKTIFGQSLAQIRKQFGGGEYEKQSSVERYIFKAKDYRLIFEAYSGKAVKYIQLSAEQTRCDNEKTNITEATQLLTELGFSSDDFQGNVEMYDMNSKVRVQTVDGNMLTVFCSTFHDLDTDKGILRVNYIGE
ncbi:MAG: hypothetical protein ACOYT9_02475 [Patescibacteria group bacterium]